MSVKSEKYLLELNERFPDGSKYDTEDVGNFLHSLSEQDAEIVYKCICANHGYKGFPKLPNVKRYLKNDNIDISWKSGNTSNVYDYDVCQICNSIYDTEIGWCPVCKKSTPIKVKISETPINGVLRGHSGCCKCSKWSDRSMGACCEEWGTGKFDAMCKECDCMDCCKDEHLRNTDYKAYKIKHNMINTRICNKDIMNKVNKIRG